MATLMRVVYDATLLTVAFSGIRRAAGLDFNPKKIENETARSIVTQYLGLGDTIVDFAGGYLKQYDELFPPSKGGKR
ncbi:hypothetical protein HDV05_004042 [Chytridiales sp. JEL 0842]|nr:hypothetical protein HDV05_004042 [Chytridiales sp. JEL 0842]